MMTEEIYENKVIKIKNVSLSLINFHMTALTRYFIASSPWLLIIGR